MLVVIDIIIIIDITIVIDIIFVTDTTIIIDIMITIVISPPHQNPLPREKRWILLIRGAAGGLSIAAQYYGMKHMPIGININININAVRKGSHA